MRMPLIANVMRAIAVVISCGLCVIACTRSVPPEEASHGDLQERSQRAQAPLIDPPRSIEVPRSAAPFGAALVDGRHLKAWTEAWASHRAISDLEPEQRTIDNYMFGFDEDADNIYVNVVPKVDMDSLTPGGENARGRSARYTVDKSTYRVLRHVFGE